MRFRLLDSTALNDIEAIEIIDKPGVIALNDELMKELLNQLERLNQNKRTSRIWWWILGWGAIGSAWAMFWIWMGAH